MLGFVSNLDTSVEAVARRIGHSVVRVCRENWVVFAIALAVSLLCYGIDVFNLGISLDEESQTVGVGPVVQWIHQDRWGMYLLNKFLLPMPTVPYISLMIGLISVSLSATIAVESWGGGMAGRFESCLAAGVMVATPILTFLMHFNTTQYGAFVGMLAGFAGVRMFIAGGWRFRTAGWVLVVFAISVYQAVGLAMACMYLVYAINRQLREPSRESSLRSVVGRPLGFAVWFGLAAVGHKLSAAFARSLVPEHHGYDLVDSVYAGTFLQWYSIERVALYIQAYLTGEKWYLGQFSYLVLVAGLFIIFTRFVYRERFSWGLPFGLLLVAGLILTPFALVIGTGMVHWPTRTLLGFPVVLAGVVFTGLGTRSAIARLIFAGLAMTCLIWFVVTNNRLMFADHQQWRIDQQVLFDIQWKLEVAGFPTDRPMRLVVVGQRAWKRPTSGFQEETIGASFFGYNRSPQNATTRLARLLQISGIGNIYGVANPEQYRAGLDLADSMPSWPAPGSVVIGDGVAVVKLSPATPDQLKFGGR